MNSEKVKKIGKEILKKIPVFIFCVVFINGYNWLCGVENSIVGVVLLMGILILLGTDLEYDVRQASASIFLLFVILAFAPKLSLINPFIGLLVNVVSITLILLLSAHNITEIGHLPFTMGYIMLQGYDVSDNLFDKRWISLLIGGAVITLIYFLSHMKKSNKISVKTIFTDTHISSAKTQWYIRLTTTICLVMFIGDLVGFPKTMWISLTVLSLSTPLEAEYKSRIIRRIPATLIGSVAVFSLFELFVPEQYQTMVILMAGFLSMFITSYFIKTIYNSFSALITALLLFPADQAVVIRIIANIVGSVIAIISIIGFSKIFAKINKSKVPKVQ